MTYTVKEIFYTLQGEGANAGRPAMFLRFSGCNLWTGLEADRSTAVCKFCDTDFVGVGPDGGKFKTADELANFIDSKWPRVDIDKKFVVCTGGEPLLQLDEPLIDALHEKGFEVAVETNGTIETPHGIDWLCVSPKSNSILKVKKGNELKFVFPQPDVTPESFENLDFQYFLLQPMDDYRREENVKAAIAYCKEHPQWRLSVQMHKIIGIR